MTTTRQGFALEPLDTLLFRDGRPFDQSDEGLTETRSLFPPFPSVAAAALRARLARNMGWSGRGPWDTTITDVLGSGPFNAGQCRFGPPIVMLASSNPHASASYSAYFPCPAAVVGQFDPEKKTPGDRTLSELKLLTPRRPGPNSSLRTDLALGDHQAFCSAPKGFDSLDGWLIDTSGLEKLLRGEAPGSGDCNRSEKFFVRQDRAGIKRDYATHGAADSMLYTASQVRPVQRVTSGDKVAIGVRAELPEPLAIPNGAILPLGSMGRAASCVTIDAVRLDLSGHSVKATAIKPDTQGYYHYSIVLISPAVPHPGGRGPAAGLHLPNNQHEVVSAVLPKPIAFSGWDASTVGPAPMRRYLAPGSIWYLRFKGNTDDLQAEFDRLHRDGISNEGASVGFGAVVIGTWNYAEDGKK
jgi:CRISPR-associated protein Cmr3